MFHFFRGFGILARNYLKTPVLEHCFQCVQGLGIIFDNEELLALHERTSL
jgi:hypothetical protein